MSALAISLWIVSGLLAAMYLMAGLMKAKDPAKAKEMGPTMEAQSDQKLRVIGIAEIIGAITLIVAALVGQMWLAGAAATGLVGVQAFAIPAHFKHGDTEKIAMNIILLALAAFVALGRFGVF